MALEVTLEKRPVRDEFDLIGDSNVAADGAWDTLISVEVRTGFTPRLTLVGVNVDPGGEGYVQFRLMSNKNPIPHRLYSAFTSAPGVVYDPGQRLITPVQLSEGALLELEARLVGASVAYNVYGRLRIEYVDSY